MIATFADSSSAVEPSRNPRMHQSRVMRASADADCAAAQFSDGTRAGLVWRRRVSKNGADDGLVFALQCNFYWQPVCSFAEPLLQS
jgi:tRNA U34 5-methylaminomethyl-2-thiouridine-forming methyltransferase MnmC